MSPRETGDQSARRLHFFRSDTSDRISYFQRSCFMIVLFLLLWFSYSGVSKLKNFRAFTGKYNKCYETGMYSCVVCDQQLFSSQTKYDSGCGWPAFNDVLDQGKVKLTKDTSHGMVRTEVTCTQCGAHLGHMFGDGPAPTRKRFCINSASLQFHPATGDSQDGSDT